MLKRESLKLLIQFIDSRHDIQKNDRQMQEWIDYHNLPCVVVATKIDLTSKSRIQAKVNEISRELNKTVFPFSVRNSYYNDNIIKYINNIVENS